MTEQQQLVVEVAQEVYQHLEALIAIMATSKTNSGKLMEVPAEVLLGPGNVDKDITLVLDIKCYWNARLRPDVAINIKGPTDEN